MSDPEHQMEIEVSRQPAETQSAFASTLLADTEGGQPTQVVSGSGTKKGNLYGSAVDTTAATAGPDHDPVYAAKAQLLNDALLDLGMGRHQWATCFMTAIGWFLDEFWLFSLVVILPSAANEAQFFFSGQNPTHLEVSVSVGLVLGAVVWPVLSDYAGRKSIFTSTIVLMGMSGLVGAGMPAFTGLCLVGFVLGLAVGGNLPVDGILLMENLPANRQWLIALQGVFWGLGKLVASANGWAFVELYTCGTGPDAVSTSASAGSRSTRRAHSSFQGAHGSGGASSCHYVSNKGWRYAWWCFGCITVFLYLFRFMFRFSETPKSLLARRRDAEAVQAVKDIAATNKQSTWLEESSLARADSVVGSEKGLRDSGRRSLTLGSAVRAVVKAGGALNLVALLFVWGVFGLIVPLHHNYLNSYLTTKGVEAVNASTVTTPYFFSRHVYIAVCAIPGPLAASALIETKLLGRRGAGSILSLITGVLMLASAASRSRDAVLAFECVLAFLQFAGLAILTTYTIEVFSGPVRGCGMAATGLCWRILGLVAWVAVAEAPSAPSGAPIWLSGALSIVVAGAWLALRVETRGRAAA